MTPNQINKLSAFEDQDVKDLLAEFLLLTEDVAGLFLSAQKKVIKTLAEDMERVANKTGNYVIIGQEAKIFEHVSLLVTKDIVGTLKKNEGVLFGKPIEQTDKFIPDGDTD